MSERKDIEDGLAQMKFEIADDGAIKLPLSTPATYEFENEATLDEAAFEAAIDDYGFSVFDTIVRENENGFYYKTDLMTDHYKRIVVKVWKETANIYPKEKQTDHYELARIVHAIEDAFDAELTHSTD